MLRRITMLFLMLILCSCTVTVSAAKNPFSDRRIVRTPKVNLQKGSKEKVTIMIYMNGSDLESEDQEATNDLKEMIKAGNSDQVNVVVQTMGTKKWSKSLGIASNRSQRYEVTGNGLVLVNDKLGQLDCTVSKTLEDFVTWSAKEYPADRYIMLFWNHGAGSVYGFGYDEYQDWNASLTLDEMQKAFHNAGVYFDFIGMDCCIMSNLEVCCAFYDYCDYVILSEDFESGLGWYYTNWLKKLYKNPAIDTPTLAKTIIDDMVAKNEEEDAGEAILSLIDQGKMKLLMTAWKDFAYKNEKALTGKNYSQKRTRSGPVRVHPKFTRSSFFSWWDDEEEEDDAAMSDYYVTDIMAVAQNIDSDESDALSSALNSAIVYTNSTDGDSGMTGLAITLPYGDSEFYSELKTVFTNCGLDKEYINWLKTFVDAKGSSNHYDYDEWEDEWEGWDDYDDDYDWDLWDFLFGDDDDEYWEDDEYWGWADDDDEPGFLDFLDAFLEDDDDYYDDDFEYDEHGGFLNWLLSDDDDDYDDYDYDDYDDYGGSFLSWLLSD
ncbi:MAG: hypothetical protein KBT01_07670 [Clostridiales bacterium]|nr:hypothetical protein [Candidatus Blautia equi]